jgi:hypothetical protein
LREAHGGRDKKNEGEEGSGVHVQLLIEEAAVGEDKASD